MKNKIFNALFCVQGFTIVIFLSGLINFPYFFESDSINAVSAIVTFVYILYLLFYALHRRYSNFITFCSIITSFTLIPFVFASFFSIQADWGIPLVLVFLTPFCALFGIIKDLNFIFAALIGVYCLVILIINLSGLKKTEDLKRAKVFNYTIAIYIIALIAGIVLSVRSYTEFRF